MTKWLVAGEAVYQIIGRSGDTFTTVIEAGTTNPLIIGKRVTFTKSEIAANVQAGVLRITDTAPRVAPPTPTKKKGKRLL